MRNKWMSFTLTETEEECVHTHSVNTEEAVSDQIGPKHHSLQTIGNIIITQSIHENLPLPDQFNLLTNIGTQ